MGFIIYSIIVQLVGKVGSVQALSGQNRRLIDTPNVSLRLAA